MEDIGLHPDAGKPDWYEHEYETLYADSPICPFCGDEIDLISDYDFEDVCYAAANEENNQTMCRCGAQIKIEFTMSPREEVYGGICELEVEAIKRIA